MKTRNKTKRKQYNYRESAGFIPLQDYMHLLEIKQEIKATEHRPDKRKSIVGHSEASIRP